MLSISFFRRIGLVASFLFLSGGSFSTSGGETTTPYSNYPKQNQQLLFPQSPKNSDPIDVYAADDLLVNLYTYRNEICIICLVTGLIWTLQKKRNLEDLNYHLSVNVINHQNKVGLQADRLNEIEERLQTAQEKNKQAKKTIGNLKKEVSDLEERQLNKQLLKLNKENINLKKNIDELYRQIMDLKQKDTSLRNKTDEILKNYTSFEQDYKRLYEENQQLDFISKQQQHQLNILSDEIHRQNEKISASMKRTNN